jgi:uncharacterized protein (DUF885 family)
MATVRELADRYVEEMAALDPVEATAVGIAGHDEELTDYSPDGIAARAELDRRTLAALGELASIGGSALDDAERAAAAVMKERIEARLLHADTHEHLRDLAVLGSAVQHVRQVFDLMDTSTDEGWERIATRMAAVPECLASLRAAYAAGSDAGVVAARRQALGCAQQAAVWGGLEGDAPFFHRLAARCGTCDSALRDRLAAAAAAATEAYAQLATWLREEYAPVASERDAVGEERYVRLARTYLGSDLDAREAYAWGWEELHRIEDRMVQVAERILPGAPLPEVFAHLEGPDGPAVEGEDALVAWLQDLLDTTVRELDGTHFDIPERVRRVEAMIAPPGGPAAMYYTPPSEDFSRPGRTWYPTLGKTRFPLWREVSICYHEGVPGHHLQVAQVVHLAERLNRFQRLLAWTSGHGEGWALYAERLMGELGYLDEPAYELGMLSAQAMRAVRVIVDIGMHLELRIPDGEAYHPGERWTPELALPFVIERSRFPDDFMRSEVDRYLGLPGQAISYKLGERVWLEARDDARRRHGPAFDLKAFHSYALDLGNMGLDLLRTELARF